MTIRDALLYAGLALGLLGLLMMAAAGVWMAWLQRKGASNEHR